MEEDANELDHLDGGQILFPPKVFLVLGSHGSQQVVGVHYDVNERVDEAEESAVAAR